MPRRWRYNLLADDASQRIGRASQSSPYSKMISTLKIRSKYMQVLKFSHLSVPATCRPNWSMHHHRSLTSDLVTVVTKLSSSPVVNCTVTQSRMIRCQVNVPNPFGTSGGGGATVLAFREYVGVGMDGTAVRSPVLYGIITLFDWRNNLVDNSVYGDVERCYVFQIHGGVGKIYQGSDEVHGQYYDE